MATKYEYFVPVVGQNYDSGHGTNKCQTFIAESTHLVDQIKLKLKKLSGCDHVLYGVYLYGVDVSHLPTGGSLAQLGSFYADELTTSYVEYTFEDTSYEITNETEYAIVIYTSEEITVSIVYWWTTTDDDYPTGISAYHNYLSGWSTSGATGDRWFEIWWTGKPGKPTNPSPEHEETGVVSSKTPLSYTASDPAADTYDVYFRVQGDGWTQLASEIEDITSWRMPFVYLNIRDYNPAELSGFRSPIVGDVLTHGDDSYTITHVVRGSLYGVHYEAKLYAFRTAGAGNKSGGDVLTNGVEPDINNPQAVSVTLNDQWYFRDDVEKIYLPQNTTYEWKIDATNDAGTTAGDTWEFTTYTFDPPLPAGISLSLDGDDPTGEQTGTSTGENNMITIRGLVAAAHNKIWYEDI